MRFEPSVSRQRDVHLDDIQLIWTNLLWAPVWWWSVQILYSAQGFFWYLIYETLVAQWRENDVCNAFVSSWNLFHADFSGNLKCIVVSCTDKSWRMHHLLAKQYCSDIWSVFLEGNDCKNSLLGSTCSLFRALTALYGQHSHQPLLSQIEPAETGCSCTA